MPEHVVLATRGFSSLIVTETERLTKRQKAAINAGTVLPIEIRIDVGEQKRRWVILSDVALLAHPDICSAVPFQLEGILRAVRVRILEMVADYVEYHA